MSLAQFSVRNPILANMLTIVIVVWGTSLALSLQREVFPETDLNLVVIRTVYPNASPEEVEDLITIPVEEELREIEDIEEYTSTSLEGMSVVVAQVDADARNKDRVITDIQRSVDQVNDLPGDAEDPFVTAITTAEPVIRLCVGGTAEERTMRTYGEYLRTRLERIDGVSTVTRKGWRDEEFDVAVDLERLREQDLALSDVALALARRNINLPGGKYRQGGEEVILRTMGKFHSAAEIADVVVRSNWEGKRVRVGDVATVFRIFTEDATYVKANGSRSLVLGVKKKASGDSIAIADAVKALVGEQVEGGHAPEGVELALVDDVSFYVKRRLRVLKSNGLIGIALVTVCLLLFLNFRVAVFTSLGIPFSFLGAFVIMSFYGMTINLMTMFGLIIVLGMIVDDAIIVGENVFRHLEEGMRPAEAAVRGTDEVMKPVISTILTTIAAFLPLVFAPDMYGKYLGWLVWVVVFSLLASLFEVLFVLPSHLAEFARPLRHAVSPGGTGRSVGHSWMDGLVSVYRRLLGVSLRFRYLFILLVAVGFSGCLALAVSTMRVDIFPNDMIDIFFVRITAQEGTPLEHTAELVDRVEERLRELPPDELDDIVTYMGEHLSLDGSDRTRGTHRGQLVVYLASQHLRERKTQALINEMRERCAGIDGIEEIEFEMIEPGPPVGKPLEVKIVGPSFDVLRAISAEIQAFLAERPGVKDISNDDERGKQELHVMVDEGEAARVGLSVERVAQAMFAAVEGAEATIVREGKEEIEVKVRLEDRYQNEDDIARLPILNDKGRRIDLGRIASFRKLRGMPSIMHYNGDRVITVGAHVDAEITTPASESAVLMRAFGDVPGRHPGYQLVPSGEWKETKKIYDFMVKAFFLASLLIYTILAVQFGSFLQPLVLLITIPLGLVGVILALIAHGQPISIMAMMGMVGLGGVVVNDAIVLVSFINNRRREGAPLTEAILESGIKRFRPILLTSVTTVAGLMPVIYGWGGYEPFIAPSAIALAYGLVFATFLTLVVVPVLYRTGHDLKTAARRFARFLPFRTATSTDAESVGSPQDNVSYVTGQEGAHTGSTPESAAVEEDAGPNCP